MWTRWAAGSICLRPCRLPLPALRRLLRKISVIFSNASLIESEKERNLCTKFFAGYFFNEFTAGYAKRIVQFNRYIQEVTGREDLGIQTPISRLTPTPTCATSACAASWPMCSSPTLHARSFCSSRPNT
jgi:hypothetical protein